MSGIMSNELLFAREALVQLDALRNFAFKLCRNEHHANDLVQETMLKACRSFHMYQQGTNCRAWLFQICKNSYINDYRRKQYQTVATDFTEDGSDGGADEPYRNVRSMRNDSRSSAAHEAMLGDEVATALDALPADYQTALILSDIEGYTYEEIAEFSQTPIGTIRSRIHRGRKILSEKLHSYANSQGYGPSMFAASA
jgi:RNA polymerase sigma-70 factor (ECF subfamily)